MYRQKFCETNYKIHTNLGLIYDSHCPTKTYILKLTSVKKECAGSKKSPKFGVGVIFKNSNKTLRPKNAVTHWATVDYKDKLMLKW